MQGGETDKREKTSESETDRRKAGINRWEMDIKFCGLMSLVGKICWSCGGKVQVMAENKQQGEGAALSVLV